MDKAKLEARREAKKQAQELARIESEKNQKPVKSIIITIEWKRSQTWGSNPNCEAEINFQDGTFQRSPIYKASGCGYDKESTVIADVFNNYLKYKLWSLGIIQDNAGNGTSSERKGITTPYGVHCYTDNHPHFGGGIGTNCYYKIAEFIGGKFERISGGKTFDVYKYTDLN